jgi:2'-5' RNA ligase
MTMTGISDVSPWGYFALVSYIPEPLGSFFRGLRGALPGATNPQAHITLLPPRPLRLPVNTASEQVLEVLANFPPFEVELSTVRRFPETNFLYLDIAEGNSLVHALHDALNTGDLLHAEEFEFRPHLTLGGPVPEGHLNSVQDQAEHAWLSAGHPRRFTLDEIVFLWLSPDNPRREWQRFWSYNLRTKSTARTKAASATLTNRTS